MTLFVGNFVLYIFKHLRKISTPCILELRSLQPFQGRIQDFKLGGAHLKKLRRAEGGAKLLGYFVWKITILRQKIILFSIAEGGAKILGYFVWKITILRQKIIFFSNFRGGARRVRPPPPESAPAFVQGKKVVQCVSNNIKSNMSDSKYVDIQYRVNSIG